MVKDIKSENNYQVGAFERSGNPEQLTVVGDSLYFSVIGKELWKTDGTERGTVMIKDFTSNDGGDLLELKEVNGKLVFIVEKDVARPEEAKLWTTDGTKAGTKILQDPIHTYTPFYKVGKKLYYPLRTQKYGTEIWITDGTKTGTHILKDIYKGTKSGLGAGGKFFGAIGDKLLFSANTPEYMIDGEIWITDGTENGTKRVTHLQP